MRVQCVSTCIIRPREALQPLSLLLESVFSSRDKSLSWHQRAGVEEAHPGNTSVSQLDPWQTRKLGGSTSLTAQLFLQEGLEEPKTPLGDWRMEER